MKASELCRGLLDFSGEDFEVRGICYDPLRCKQGFIYVAIDIYTQLNGVEIPDGHAGLDLAKKNGAKLCIVSKKNLIGAGVIYHPNPRKCLAELSKKFYMHSMRELKTIGLVGTNGKTTITYLLHQLLAQKSIVGYLGTLGAKIGNEDYPSKDTTPEPPDLWEYREALLQKGATISLMEVSSHGISFHRVEGLPFSDLVFTNITPDHLDFHGTFENYLQAKLTPFKKLEKCSRAYINLDTPYGMDFMKACPLDTKVMTYGVHPQADIRAENVQLNEKGICFLLKTPKGEIQIESTLLGQFNLENILAVCAVALNYGLSLEDLKGFFKDCLSAPGRLESIESEQGVKVFIDYAHTPDAMEKVLQTLKQHCPARLVCVFGCGGDRDRGKRKYMGEAACKYCDEVFITSDNSRFEDPERIFQDILEGCDLSKITKELDRKYAIEKAISSASKGDWIAILGKGHEKIQMIGHEARAFNELKIVTDFFECQQSASLGF